MIINSIEIPINIAGAMNTDITASLSITSENNGLMASNSKKSTNVQKSVKKTGVLALWLEWCLLL